jgi:hypothetical protein
LKIRLGDLGEVDTERVDPVAVRPFRVGDGYVTGDSVGKPEAGQHPKRAHQASLPRVALLIDRAHQASSGTGYTQRNPTSL